MEAPHRSDALVECLDSAVQFITGNALSTAEYTSVEPIMLPQRIESRKLVILAACDHLTALHYAIRNEESSNSIQIQVVDPSILRTAQDLLDMIVIEGLYPSLSPKVGLLEDRIKRSHLYSSITANFPDLGVLNEVFSQTLCSIVFDKGPGLSRIVRERHAIDILAANVDLAFSPARSDLQKTQFEENLNILVDEYVYCNSIRILSSKKFLLIAHSSLSVPVLYKTLTALLRPDAPNWFKEVVSESLSMLPLRSRGVQWAIEFIATSYNSDQSDLKPAISHEVLLQITKMLTAAPKRMTVESWLTKLSPQLLDLLDGKEFPELSQVAGFIITAGVLSTKSTGSPGSIGWKLFVEPQLNAFRPDTSQVRVLKKDLMRLVLVSQADLTISMNRLQVMVLSNPSSALTGRLIRPILVPLWAIYAYDGSPIIHSDWNKMALKLLEVFLKRCGTVEILLDIIHNLLWDGPSEWTFRPGSEGGIEIRARSEEEDKSMLSIVSQVHGKVSAFVQLLSNETFEDEKIVKLFLDLIKPSNLEHNSTESKKSSSNYLLDSEPDVAEELIRQQLIQALLQTRSNQLVANPKQMLEFIDQIIDQAVRQKANEQVPTHIQRNPTLANLSTIVEHQIMSETIDPSQSENLLATSVSLLNVILGVPNLNVNDLQMSRAILRNLDRLSETDSTSIAASTLSTINAARAKLKFVLDPANNDKQYKAESSLQLDQDLLERVAQDLLSTSAPERTAAVKGLQRFIMINTMALDVPTVFNLLMNQIKNDSDEFVFLAAISALQSLATARDPIFVIRNTVESFQDTHEISDVDGRLRIGEALATVIQAVMMEDFHHQNPDLAKLNSTIRHVAEVTIAVASRRGVRNRESKDRNREKRIENLNRRKEDKEWDGQGPRVSKTPQDIDGEGLNESDRILRYQDIQLAHSILNTWENTGLEEDLRIRTSALSILGELLEHCPSAFTPKLLEYSIVVARSVLYLEQGIGKEILRRAAVNVYISQLRAIISAKESKETVQADGMQWFEIENILRRVKDTDTDDLTREYASTALDGIESWKVSNLMEASHHGDSSAISELRVLGMNAPKGSTVKIEEID
jgi:hypothetical protein